MSDYCTECGMLVEKDEFHPYAACLMFMGCHDIKTVRANLEPFAEYKQHAEAAEAKLRELEMREPIGYVSHDGLDDLRESNETTLWGRMAHEIGDIPLYAKPFTAPKQEEK